MIPIKIHTLIWTWGRWILTCSPSILNKLAIILCIRMQAIISRFQPQPSIITIPQNSRQMECVRSLSMANVGSRMRVLTLMTKPRSKHVRNINRKGIAHTEKDAISVMIWKFVKISCVKSAQKGSIVRLGMCTKVVLTLIWGTAIMGSNANSST